MTLTSVWLDYPALAIFVLFVHVLFILWVVFGALLASSRPILRWLHIISLLWGIATELLSWPCPLTLVENWLERTAGMAFCSEDGVALMDNNRPASAESPPLS